VAAREIFAKYLTAGLPIHPDEVAAHGDAEAACAAMIDRTVDLMYSDSAENRFLEVTYVNGDREILYFRDFSSGAMIENIVSRAKKSAIKEFIAGLGKGIRTEHMLQACLDEFRENEDLPNTTNPDDWARVSGKKGERIVYIRTLVGGGLGSESGRSIADIGSTGAYL